MSLFGEAWSGLRSTEGESSYSLVTIQSRFEPLNVEFGTVWQSVKYPHFLAISDRMLLSARAFQNVDLAL